MLTSLLNDPETMQKLAGIASELMNGTSSDEPCAQDTAPCCSTDSGTDSTADFMCRAMPVLSAIAQSSRCSADSERSRLLHALKPFLSAHTCAQIERAEHILSAARMTQAAAGQLLPQLYQREV